MFWNETDLKFYFCSHNGDCIWIKINTFFLSFPLFWIKLSLITTCVNALVIVMWNISFAGPVTCKDFRSTHQSCKASWFDCSFGSSSRKALSFVNPLPKLRLHQPIRIGIMESSKTLLSTWWRKHAKNELLVSWIFQEESMRLISLRFLYVWLHFLRWVL